LLVDNTTACGRRADDPAVAGYLSPDPDDVTCGACDRLVCSCGATAEPGTPGWRRTDADWCPRCAWWPERPF
jgi:hypothetical protein